MIYLVHFLVINILFISSKFIKNKDFFPISTFIYSIFIFGQRWMTGTDFPYYLRYYLTGFTKNEFGYFGLQQLFASLDLYFGNFIFIIFVLTLGTMYYFIFRFEKKINLILYVYLLSDLFFSQMSQLRQFVGIGFMLISLYFAYKEDKKKSWLFAIIAGSFHNTALLLIPFIVYKPKLKNIAIYSILLISIVLPFANVTFLFKFIPFIGSYVNSYVGSHFDVGLGPFHYLRFYVSLLLIYIYVVRIDRSNFKYKDNLILNGLMLYLLFYGLSFQFAPLYRMSNYFKIFEILYLVGYHERVKGFTNSLVKSVILIFFLGIYIGSSAVDLGDIARYQFRPLRIYETKSNAQLWYEIETFNFETFD